MIRSKEGFTLVEVIVAILILTTGLLAIAAGSGSVYRMLGSGRRSAYGAALAQSRIEWLRREASRTTPRCSALVAGSTTQSNGVSDAWSLTDNGSTKTVREVVTTVTPRGSSRDTVFALIECT